MLINTAYKGELNLVYAVAQVRREDGCYSYNVLCDKNHILPIFNIDFVGPIFLKATPGPVQPRLERITLIVSRRKFNK